jgi:hypothetical protein
MSGITQTQYGYNSVKFVTEKEGQQIELDITTVIAQLNIYENLGKCGLAGRILVVDSANMFAQLQITGVEKIIIDMNAILNPENNINIKREFMLTAVLAKEIVNDSTITYLFELQEPHTFKGKIQKISKSYSGTPSQIIKNIVSGFLDKTVNVYSEPAQAVMSVIIPYITPLSATKWILKRATDIKGFPYFLYATLNSEDIQLKSLSDMMEDPAKVQKFSYGGAVANSGDPARSILSIETIKGNVGGTTLTSIVRGAVGQRYEVHDITFNYKNTEPQVKVSDYFDANLYDKNFTINNKPIDEYESTFVFDLQTPSMSFGNSYGYDRDNLNRLVTKVVRKSILTAVGTGTLKINVSAWAFMANNMNTVGNKIEIEILQLIDGKATPDEKQSGEYLIVEAKHNFYDEKHGLTLKVVKV